MESTAALVHIFRSVQRESRQILTVGGNHFYTGRKTFLGFAWRLNTPFDTTDVKGMRKMAIPNSVTSIGWETIDKIYCNDDAPVIE